VIARRSLLAALGSATLSSAGARLVAQTLPAFRVGMALTDGVTPVLYGIRTGAFKNAGVDVQLVAGNSGAALSAAVAGGSLEVAASSLMPLITGHVRGVGLRIIAGSSMYSADAPTSELCLLKTSRIGSFAEFSGKTVATLALQSLDTLGISALVDKSGGTSSSVRFLETPSSLMLSALENGRADVASISEPNLAIALESGKLRTLGDPYAGVAPGCMIAAFFCAPDFLARNRDAIERFTGALYRATAYTNTHHAETVSLLAEYAHMDPDVVRRMTRLTNATSLDVRAIQPAIDLAAKYRVIDAAFNAKELVA